jgi:hypothetical protein
MREDETHSRIKQLFLDIHSEWVRRAAWQAWGVSSWTRQRDMPLEDILMCTLAKKGLSTIMEVRHYFQAMGKAEQIISNQDYLRRG